MARCVGAFETVFFRGFVQTRLCESLGLAPGMALVRNVLVLWPFLTPLGSFFNNLNSGNIELPWESILGFADVLGLWPLPSG